MCAAKETHAPRPPAPERTRIHDVLAVLTFAACLFGPPLPRVAIVIDDIGYRVRADLDALGLGGAYSYAILPHTPHGARFAVTAQALSRDSLLHLPMEAERRNHLLGPGALRREMDAAAVEATVTDALASVPTAIGISNHMGSRLTADAAAMRTLAASVALRPGLAFIDSRTTARTAAASEMRRRGVPVLERDVFLDDVAERSAIRRRLEDLVTHAKRHGSALGIGHPHAATLSVLRDWRPRRHGVALVPISVLLEESRAAADEPTTVLCRRGRVSQRR